MTKKIMDKFNETFPNVKRIPNPNKEQLSPQQKQQLEFNEFVMANEDENKVTRRNRYANYFDKALAQNTLETLEESIAIFRKFKDETMTGRVVMLELMVLRDKNEK